MDPRRMFQREAGPGKLEDEFNRPVESIMRCDDFKSNFARRLSNRYISRSAAVTRIDSTRSLQPDQHPINENIPDIPKAFPTPKRDDQQSVGTPDPPMKVEMVPVVKPVIKSSMSSSVMRQTNMEVETLRWQLAQTEANRQMHITLLKQIVNFLNRVKEHIKAQSNDEYRKESLPRSRSVVHVNKNVEYSLAPPKKISTKKISKSISNVNGYKELWQQTRMTVESAENEATQKISEEMSRLITLATTVLGTEIPDLACSCNDSVKPIEISKGSELLDNSANEKLTKVPKIVVESTCENTDVGNDTYVENKVDSLLSLRTDGSEVNCASIQPFKETENNATAVEVLKTASASKPNTEKPNNFNVANFIEDESGFSSMSSFQELGIPIIGIVAPPPLKENGYTDNIVDILRDPEKWKNNIEIGKQPMKVFWV